MTFHLPVSSSSWQEIPNNEEFINSQYTVLEGSFQVKE